MSKEDLTISDMKKMQMDLNITAEEFSKVYVEKHNSNMTRNYEKDNKSKYNDKTF